MMNLNRTPNSENESSLSAAFVKVSIEGYSKFLLAYQSFGVDEKLVLQEFQLDSLTNSSTWIIRVKPNPNELSLAGRIRQALETFPKFINVVQRESEKSRIVVGSPDEKTSKPLKTRKVTFLIRESDAPSLTLKDLSSVISDIESIFQVIIKIGGGASSDLIVAALDSGSDKSLDLVGAAAAVEKLSTFLLEAWDRIRYARTGKLRASIKTASEGLTLLNELKATQEKGAVSAEEAEKLKRVLLKSVDDLFLKGVYTSDMEQSVPLQPSALEFQRTKLLTHYGEHDPSPPSDESTKEIDSEDEG